MKGTRQRLLPAGLLALILHGAALSWQPHQGQPTLSTPLPVQRIAVSLGTRPVTKEPPTPTKQIKKPEKKEAVVAQAKPKPTHPESPPMVQLTSKPAPIVREIIHQKAQSKQQAPRVASPPVPPSPPAENNSRKNTVPPLEIEVGDERSKENAAHVIQQASPLYQVNPPPKYPRLARRRSLEGVVLLEAFIDAAGEVAELNLFTSSGHPILDQAALKAVRRWRFRAGTIDGNRHEMWVKVPVRFQLR
ncbi:MAG: energy transducer TonB [Proteobacteria bacterium]|nr:energy transducer TonB [Pseudomonadota bacterium]MBU1640546.1 energy transducer TonB [Pseudomonadota bacterium]